MIPGTTDQAPSAVSFGALGLDRAQVVKLLRELGIGTQVHYIPVHLQPYYPNLYRSGPGAYHAKCQVC